MRHSTLRILSILLLLSEASLNAQWSGNSSQPTKVCTAPGEQHYPLTVPNGAGGSIVAWQDGRNGNGNNDIYIENLSSSGTLLWSVANSYLGKAVCTAAGNQYLNDMVTDALGNTFIAWMDYRNSPNTSDIYIQKFNSGGVAQWALDGVPLVNANDDQETARLTSDGAGGVIAVCADYRNDVTNEGKTEVYVQRLNSDGTPLWTANGVRAYESAILSYPTDIIADGSGGAIIAMIDARNSTIDRNGDHTNIDIYAQRINADGILLWTTNGMPVCTQSSNQILSNWTTVSDASGGAIFYWYDYRNDPGNGNAYPNRNADIYAQRLNSSGAPLWASNGVAISTAADDIYLARDKIMSLKYTKRGAIL